MQVRLWKRMLLVCVISIIGVAMTAQADVYLKYEHHTDGFQMMGRQQPAKKTVRETWIGEDKVRNDEGGRTTILRLDTRLVYFIDHAHKRYSQMPLNMDKMADQAIEGNKDMSAEEKKQAKEVMQGVMHRMSKFRVNVKETGEKKKIGKWMCKKYTQSMNTPMGPLEAEVWATPNIKMDYAMFNKMQAASMMMMPGMRDAMGDYIKEMNKIKGIMVLSTSTTNMMNTHIKSTQKLLKASNKQVDAAFYNPPKGYTRQAN